VDGNDVVAVYTTTKEAVDRARAGEGPILIEAKSMRMRGHAQHDPAEYVPKDMFEYWKQRDPIVLYEKFWTGAKLLDAKSKKEIDDRIDNLLTKERDYAESRRCRHPNLPMKGCIARATNATRLRPSGKGRTGR